MSAEEVAERIFVEERGLHKVNIRWDECAEVKILYSYFPLVGGIDIMMTDYLKDAPDEVFEDIFGRIAKKVLDHKGCNDCGAPTVKYILTPRFWNAHHDAFFKRSGVDLKSHAELIDNILIMRGNVDRVYRSAVFETVIYPRDVVVTKLDAALKAQETTELRMKMKEEAMKEE